MQETFLANDIHGTKMITNQKNESEVWRHIGRYIEMMGG